MGRRNVKNQKHKLTYNTLLFSLLTSSFKYNVDYETHMSNQHHNKTVSQKILKCTDLIRLIYIYACVCKCVTIQITF